jgi:hypothetical protein
MTSLSFPSPEIKTLFKELTKTASGRQAKSLGIILDAGNSLLKSNIPITVVSLGDISQKQGGPTSRTIYNNPDLYGKFSEDLAAHQKEQKRPNLDLTSSNEYSDVDTLIQSLSGKDKSIVQSMQNDIQRLQAQSKIMQLFFDKLEAKDIVPLHTQTPEIQQTESIKLQNTGISQEDKDTIQSFLTQTLFDEGYDIHNGDLFFAKGNRSVGAQKFVTLMKKLLAH